MAAQTRIVARAVIQKGHDVLLCRAKGKGHFFFPGGAIEFRESAVDALRREMQEELGATLRSASFIGALENQFVDRGTPAHEVYFMFSVEIEDTPITSKEDHIDFIWMPVADLERENVLPKHMVQAVAQ